jgi:hypothetical protein
VEDKMSIPNGLDFDRFMPTWNRICREMGNNFKVELGGKSSESTRVYWLTACEDFFTSEDFDAVRTGARCHFERKMKSLRMQQDVTTDDLKLKLLELEGTHYGKAPVFSTCRISHVPILNTP